MTLATEYVDTPARATGVTFDGSPLCCHASTRKGTPCQRVPLPGSKYCPSHKHLDEDSSRRGRAGARVREPRETAQWRARTGAPPTGGRRA